MLAAVRIWRYSVGTMKALRIALLTFLVLAPTSRCWASSHAKYLPYCRPSDLDISLLPPAATSPIPSGHLLVFEIKNVGRSVCRLDGPTLELLPAIPPDNHLGQIDSIGSTSKGVEVDNSLGWMNIAPGHWLHLYVEWSSERYTRSACGEWWGGVLRLVRKGQGEGEDAVVPVVARFKNLRIDVCSTVFLSNYRAGRYKGGPILSKDPSGAKDSLAGYGKIPNEIPGLPIVEDDPGYKAKSAKDRILIGRSFSIVLDGPPDAYNSCDYEMMRRRESHGPTVITFQDCADSPLSTKDSAWFANGAQRRKEPATEDLTVSGMMPTHVGPVRYDFVANAGSLTHPRWVATHINLVAHDAKPPGEATIVAPLPECKRSQLKFSAPPPIISAPTKVLRAYNATNISRTACSLAGVPKLTAYGGSRYGCPNCTNDLFAIRPNGRIDLKPGESAHFLVGNEIPHPKLSGYDDTRGNIYVAMGWNPDAVKLPFVEPGWEGLEDESAWRAGKFDNDPMNRKWAKTHPGPAMPTTPVPPDCDKPKLLAKGHPVMLTTRNGVAFGISLTKIRFMAGKPITLHVWVDNTNNVPVGIYTCPDITRFKAEGFDLFDAYGHRIFRKSHASIAQECREDPEGTRIEPDVFGCLDSARLVIPAHGCMNTDIYFEYDHSTFKTNLAADYVLPPGEYTLRPRDWHEEGAYSCKNLPEPVYDGKPGPSLTFSVMQP